ncbi:endodeoxyribonuclease [Purpureocillium takamizusanense]|uniref:DNA topoisomerase (ATP-hydrolyzing) n=1 Tax=Purpureocillium takamizusanense TaxID=2060973 RepID=A0A9Q8QD72_9HYPO|nr:endodeoxyribonuclease [Purpureocillium takamizusanense]UNI18564.1 endodeoxyribonuclease [Purpureocillium takamizusanense]
MPEPVGAAAAPAYNTRSHTDGASASPNSATSGFLIARMEGILESVADALSGGHELQLELLTRGSQRMQELCFPGKTVSEGQKFARLLLILQLSHNALVSGRILTKRQIYYQHKELFGKQRVVDELVDDLAATLSVQRHDLNIVATAKGLCFGPLVIHLHDGTVIDASLGDTGTPIPLVRVISALECPSIRWVLVVEKDAIFRPLVSTGFWTTTLCGPGLLITAKGYPDLITRNFVNLFYSTHPEVPIIVLADFDPDGLNIFRCYWPDNENLTTGEPGHGDLGLRLLGVKSDHIIDVPAADSGQTRVSQEFLPDHQSPSASIQYSGSATSVNCRFPAQILSVRDRKHVRGTLARVLSHSGAEEEAVGLVRELQVMLMMGVKAEMQWLDDSGDMTQWLEDKLTMLLSP